MPNAFEPYELGGLTLANRIVMAPMTRSRAYGPGASATDMMATYYAQRAGAGLIVTEGIQPSAIGQGYPDTPGLHSPQQVAAWRKVTGAVHAEGGLIFAQLMHTGRVGHAGLHPDGQLPVGPSAVAAVGQVFTKAGPIPFPVPHALTEPEIEQTIADYANAASNAITAGFDGVELHGANSYLIHQFLATSANQRTGRWGGSIHGRIRFALEVAAACAAAIGPDRLGIRLSPGITGNGIAEDDIEPMYLALVDGLANLGLVYIHLLEAPQFRPLIVRLRHEWPRTFILNPNTRPQPTGLDELALIEDGTTDLLSFGALFLANPDLPARLAAGGPFNAPDRTRAYGGDHHGYTDYPTLADLDARDIA